MTDIRNQWLQFLYPQFIFVSFCEISLYIFIENSQFWSLFESRMIFDVQNCTARFYPVYACLHCDIHLKYIGHHCNYWAMFPWYRWTWGHASGLRENIQNAYFPFLINYLFHLFISFVYHNYSYLFILFLFYFYFYFFRGGGGITYVYMTKRNIICF